MLWDIISYYPKGRRKKYKRKHKDKLFFIDYKV